MTAVAFNLIGPLDVRCSGEPVVVRAARQRSLLAALLVRANQPVSKHTLCLAVWGERPSDQAEVTLRSYVMRLRRALGPTVSDRLSVHSSGYLLRLEQDDELDLLRVQEHIRRGKAAARLEDWRRSLEEFHQGIALWRGEPLCDVPSESLRLAVLPVLAELRTQLWEGLYAAATQLGRAAECIVPLQRLVTEEPVSERLSGLLMSALARCGRRIDALAEYRRLRRALISEQGVEPCASVQEQHRLLLRDRLGADGTDETTEPRASGVRSHDQGQPRTVAPRQLPRGAAAFVGRTRELDELTHLLSGQEAGRGAAPVVAITGTAGVGKSELAIAAAHRVAGHYPDGQLYAELGTDSPDRVLARFLRSLGADRLASAGDPDERIAQYRSLLADRRMLIVLDDATDAEQVRPLIPGGASCVTLVTSWRPLSQLAQARCTTLGELPDADGTRILGALLGKDRVADEADAAASIVAACAGLPLALRVAAARLAARPGWPLGHLADLLAEEGSRLDELTYGRLSVRASLARTFRMLGEPRSGGGVVRGGPLTAAAAFRLLGRWQRAEFTVVEAAAEFGRPAAEVTPALEELVDANLLAALMPGSYRLHPLVRMFAIELAAEAAEQYVTSP